MSTNVSVPEAKNGSKRKIQRAAFTELVKKFNAKVEQTHKEFVEDAKALLFTKPQPQPKTSAYLEFFSEIGPSIQQQHPDKSQSERVKIIAAEWGKKNEEEREPYREKARIKTTQMAQDAADNAAAGGSSTGNVTASSKKNKKEKAPKAPSTKKSKEGGSTTKSPSKKNKSSEE